MRIAVAGGSGMLGRPVVESLLERGHELLVLGRSKERIEQAFGSRVQACALDLENAGRGKLGQALEGSEALHISLSGHGSRRRHRESQIRSVDALIEAAKAVGISSLTYLSAATVEHPMATSFYDNLGKRAAEKRIQGSGIPYQIFRPSWFVETLELFERGNKLISLGKSEHPQAWLSANDYAEIVADCLESGTDSRTVWVGGPEELSISEALSRYAQAGGLKLKSYGLGFARVLARLGGGSQLRHAADLMEYFERVPDYPQGSEKQLRTRTGFSEWLSARASQGAGVSPE